MGKYIGKRLLMMIVVVFGISFIVFTIMNLTPGNAAYMILGQSASPERVAQLEEELGLNDPFFIQSAFKNFPIRIQSNDKIILSF